MNTEDIQNALHDIIRHTPDETEKKESMFVLSIDGYKIKIMCHSMLPEHTAMLSYELYQRLYDYFNQQMTLIKN